MNKITGLHGNLKTTVTRHDTVRNQLVFKRLAIFEGLESRIEGKGSNPSLANPL